MNHKKKKKQENKDKYSKNQVFKEPFRIFKEQFQNKKKEVVTRIMKRKEK